MSGFCVKQPNGLYCRFSLTLDCPTDINLPSPPADCFEYAFSEVIDSFLPNNMPTAQFNALLRKMGYDGDLLKTPRMGYDPEIGPVPIEEPDREMDVRDWGTVEKPLEKARRRYMELRKSGKMPTPADKFHQHPTPLRAIRLYCIDCQGGTRRGPAICDTKNCPLWQFRMGKMPKIAGNAPPLQNTPPHDK